MDKTDRAIIRLLEQDARMSNVALAEAVRLTPGPCLRRVQRLEADGVIVGYRALVDPAAVARGFEVILDIELGAYDQETVAHFESTLTGFDEVVELMRLFGSPDYQARVAVADLVTYEAFLTGSVMTIHGLLKVSSRFPMKVLKADRPLPHGPLGVAAR